MKLVSPKGVVVTVSDAKAEKLLARGYHALNKAPKEDVQPAPKRRGRPKKTQE